jgi:FAD/FMN-containing dehydrogenase
MKGCLNNSCAVALSASLIAKQRYTKSFPTALILAGKAGGCVPIYGGVVLAMDRLGSVLRLSAPDLTVRAQPGVVLGELQAAVEEQELFYPPDPASLAWCTLGGNVATNAGGPRALRYGTTRDYVLGLEAGALPSL